MAAPLGISVHDHIIVGKGGHAGLKGMRLIIVGRRSTGSADYVAAVTISAHHRHHREMQTS
jgi:DNA repair protein RadC